MTYNPKLVLCFDGASQNKPHGPAGCGWALYKMDKNGAVRDWVAQDSIYLGYDVSNNQAEYEGLSRGVQYMRNNDITCDGLYVRGDSEVVIKQLAGI
eukprot:15329414-Ditylum_brightwellii.AAC.1